MSWVIKGRQTTQKNYFHDCPIKFISSKDNQNTVLEHAFFCEVISKIFALDNTLIPFSA